MAGWAVRRATGIDIGEGKGLGDVDGVGVGLDRGLPRRTWDRRRLVTQVLLEAPGLAVDVDPVPGLAVQRARPRDVLGEHGGLEALFVRLPVGLFLTPGRRRQHRLVQAAVEDGRHLPGRRVVPVREFGMNRAPGRLLRARRHRPARHR